MKFREDTFRGFQVTERTRFVTDRQTDGRTDRQTPGEKQYVSQPFGGRHNNNLIKNTQYIITKTNYIAPPEADTNQPSYHDMLQDDDSEL